MSLIYTWAAGKAGWLTIIGALLAGVMFQQVRVSNAQARTARAEQALASYKTAVAETARIAQAAADRKKEQQLTQQKEAADAARTREATLRADADGARTELGRLRSAIAAASRRDLVPSPAGPAVPEPASPVAELFGACAAEVQELGRIADGHASDVRTLIESWPK